MKLETIKRKEPRSILSDLLRSDKNTPLEQAVDLLNDNTVPRGNDALEAALRNSSLLDLSDMISIETTFIRDLKFIHKNVRFSIDIKSCFLIRQTRGMFWEYKIVIEQHKFNKEEGWLRLPSHLHNSIETLLSMKVEMSESVSLNCDEQDPLLFHLLNTENAHLECFRYERGGVLFIPSEATVYNQFDKIYLSNVASIISFCVEKDTSSRFLSDVYLNLKNIAEQTKNISSDSHCTNSIPAAYLDEDSGLPNQAGFLRLLRHLIDARHNKFYVIVISIDKFAYFCNLFEEETKRLLLASAINRIKSVIQGNNSISHVSTSDLAFVLMEPDGAIVNKTVNKILNVFSEDIQVKNIKVRFDICAGYSVYPASGKNADDLLKMANVALFRASNKSSNRFVAYKEGMEKELKLHIELGRSIRQAINRDEFEVFFQPIVDAKNEHEVCHYEALVRWMHPNEGMISPALFIEIAEASGDIIHLGYWVTERVCKHLARSGVPNNLSISINLSPVQISENNLAQNMLDILHRYQISAGRISFEITETAAMLDPGLTSQRFDELKRAGFKLSVDDFGTGHSSLSYLLNFSFEFLKIDKSFIDNSASNKGYAVIAQSMIQMAHRLGMAVICEGIETKTQYDMVKDWGTNYIQGYLISRPMPIEHFYPNITDCIEY